MFWINADGRTGEVCVSDSVVIESVARSGILETPCARLKALESNFCREDFVAIELKSLPLNIIKKM